MLSGPCPSWVFSVLRRATSVADLLWGLERGRDGLVRVLPGLRTTSTNLNELQSFLLPTLSYLLS